ncbi:MAG: hypothetical protein PHI59_01685 [Candidatus Omnitrophica bacterium]|nr:hypothetical protein [Candidatus Omnitrophota bacterium]
MDQNKRDARILTNIELSIRLIVSAMEEVKKCIKNNPLDDKRYFICKSLDEELDTRILSTMMFLSTPPDVIEALRNATDEEKIKHFVNRCRAL